MLVYLIGFKFFTLDCRELPGRKEQTPCNPKAKNRDVADKDNFILDMGGDNEEDIFGW